MWLVSMVNNFVPALDDKSSGSKRVEILNGDDKNFREYSEIRSNLVEESPKQKCSIFLKPCFR